jgi:hypothetical protein
MTYHRLETREGDRFYHEAEAGEPIVFLRCSSGSNGAWVHVQRAAHGSSRLIEH